VNQQRATSPRMFEKLNYGRHYQWTENEAAIMGTTKLKVVLKHI